MKKRLFFAGVMCMVGLAGLAGCSKEHQCKCETTDVEDDGTLKVFVLEGSISCEDITEMAFEKHVSIEGGTTLERYEVHKVKCRSYGD